MTKREPQSGDVRYGFAILTEAESGEPCAIRIRDASLICHKPSYRSQSELAEISAKRDPFKNVGAVIYLPNTSIRVRESVMECIAVLAADDIEG